MSRSFQRLRLAPAGSDEEKQDVLNAYTSSKGDFDTILTQIMCSTIDDEDRFITLINDGIASGDLKATAQWRKASKDTKARDRRRARAGKEAAEAEAYAKELGVHDKLNGGKNKGKGKGKGKQADEAEEDDDEAGLRALIQGNQAKRMDALMESLESKYGGGSDKKGKKRASTGGPSDDPKGSSSSSKKKRKSAEAEPTEEEFAAIQAKMDADRARKAQGKKGK